MTRLTRRGFARHALALATTAAVARAGDGPPLLLVADKAGDRVVFVDADRLEVVDQAPTGRHPHELAADPAGRWVAAANYGAGDSVSLIDVASRRSRRTIDLGSDRDPHGLVVNRGGTRLYVTCEAKRTVVEVDPAAGRVLRSIDTGQALTHMLALATDGRTLYAADLRGGEVAAIDLEAGRVSARVHAGDGCEGIAVSPDGRQVWTANKAEDTLTVLDARDLVVIRRISCRGRPIRVGFTPDGQHALVTCARAGELAVVERERGRELRRIKSGAWPIGLVVDPTGSRAFVADTEDGRITAIDWRRGEILGRLALGGEPDGMALVSRVEKGM